MLMFLVLTTLASLAVTSPVLPSQTWPPAFCNKLECPKYTMVKSTKGNNKKKVTIPMTSACSDQSGARTGAVLSFGGFASETDWTDTAKALAESLDNATVSYHKDFYYTAGYNSPFQLFDRHNEVWFIKKD
ncbi:Heme-binding protein 2 [Branchiostoma belcheri]|nr:Heme-binding protein 2 [Branchiostoma belcheri]